MQDDLIKKFIDKLKAEKGDEEAGKYLAGMIKFGSTELYLAIVTALTDEDFAEIEKIPDDAVAKEEIIKLFKAKTGVTPEEFLVKVRDSLIST